MPRKVRIVLDVEGVYEYDVKNAGRTLIVSVYPPVMAKISSATPPGSPLLRPPFGAPRLTLKHLRQWRWPLPRRNGKQKMKPPHPGGPRNVKRRPSEANA